MLIERLGKESTETVLTEIRRLIEQKNASVTQLAEKTDYSPIYLQSIIDGKQHSTIGVVSYLAKELGIKISKTEFNLSDGINNIHEVHGKLRTTDRIHLRKNCVELRKAMRVTGKMIQDTTNIKLTNLLICGGYAPRPTDEMLDVIYNYLSVPAEERIYYIDEVSLRTFKEETK